MSQTAFKAALLDPEQPVPGGLVDGQGQPAGRRFSVYRNNVTVSLIEALAEGFPAIFKLLGEANFTNIAREYLRKCPPASPLMMLYGKDFPAHLGSLPQLEKLGYLPDVARFEYLLRESYHAADSTPIAPDTLAQIDPEQLGKLRFTFAPATRLMRSAWPVLSIWRYATQDGAPKPDQAGENILITRPEFDPTPYLLPAGGATFVLKCQAGETLEQSALQAAEKSEYFDLSSVLSTLLAAQAIAQVSLEEIQ